MEKQYANIQKALAALGISAAEIAYSTTPQGEDVRQYGNRLCGQIMHALEAAREDAVQVVRCKDCSWCIRAEMLRKPKCTCPQLPAHSVGDNDFCSCGEPRMRHE